VIGDWQGFFAAQAGVFAALTGLVFVALSINLKEILDGPGLTGRAAEAIVILVEPVLTGMAGLLPHQSAAALGAELLVVGVSGWAMISLILVSGRVALRQRSAVEVVTRLAMVQVTSLLMVVAGVLLTTGVEGGLYWQAAGAAACLVTGIFEAWVLLVEILR
jgi:hypothetical protein